MIRKKIYQGDDLLTVSKKQETSLSLFWYGFAIYQLFFFLASTESPWLTAASCQGFQIIGFAMMIMGGMSLMSMKFDSGYLKTLFTINLLYTTLSYVLLCRAHRTWTGLAP